MAVDINSCLSSDLISLRSIPKPIGRTDQLPETGAAAIEPGVDADGAGPPAEIAVPIWPKGVPHRHAVIGRTSNDRSVISVSEELTH